MGWNVDHPEAMLFPEERKPIISGFQLIQALGQGQPRRKRRITQLRQPLDALTLKVHGKKGAADVTPKPGQLWKPYLNLLTQALTAAAKRRKS